MLKVELLNNQHNRTDFDCGNSELNAYLKQTARQHNDKGLSRTFVLIEDTQPDLILGFFTLAICEIEKQVFPASIAKKYPNSIPAGKLARLAISENHQKQGYGKLLMLHAMQHFLKVSQSVGIIGVFVDAKNQQAARYYEQYGFVVLPDNPLQLFLPLETLKQIFEQAQGL
jgi:ribosomal protein S18 acetylase RimI-like enzyme